MRGRRRVFGLAALLSILLAIPFVFGLGIVDVSKLPFAGSSSPVEPLSSTVSVFVDPAVYLNRSKTSGERVQFDINVSGTADMNLFTWQVNVTWNPAILNFSRAIYGDGSLLRATTSPNGTSSWINRNDTYTQIFYGGSVYGYGIMNVNNTLGFAGIAETILGTYSGVNGSGRLATVEFDVVGYGSTDINLSLTGSLKTTLLNSTGADITPQSADVQSGYFRNKKPGDVDGDHDVDFDDFSLLRTWYTYPAGALKALYGYNRECDFEGDFDGTVDFDDFSLLRAWYTYPKGPLDP